mmetsp:Transcript_12192/g.23133  ORF Transcript_12192/g.23133 Transcript_12192/m.23133 type:complete len:196 (+) Transcript_12192:44-631(+)
MRSDKLNRRLPSLSLPVHEPVGLAQTSAPQVPIRVSHNLYIGSYSSTFDASRLKSLGISAILNLAGDNYPLRHSSFDYASLKMSDSPRIDIKHILTLALEFIERNILEGRTVMIHCVKGLSRAPTVACAYLMWKQSLDFGSALSIIKASCPDADPNLGFVSQLECFMQPADDCQDAYDHNSSRPMLGDRLNYNKL